jgi:prevent-host-death family protein
MMEVSVRDLKNHLSEYLRRVRAGEDIVVTSHGRAVARLSALECPESEAESDEVLIRRMRSLPGGVRGATGKRLKPPDNPLAWPEQGPSLSDLVLADRE